MRVVRYNDKLFLFDDDWVVQDIGPVNNEVLDSFNTIIIENCEAKGDWNYDDLFD